MVLVLLQNQSFTLVHQQYNQQNTSGRQTRGAAHISDGDALCPTESSAGPTVSCQLVQLSSQDLV